jgi:hypothetical protein
MESSAAGGIIHILESGKFSFLAANSATEYWPSPSLFTTASIGRIVYIGSTPGSFTFDPVTAVTSVVGDVGTRNLIQIGTISNTVVVSSALTQIDLEISITGDGRGPIDNTQFQLTTGESITVASNAIPPVCAISDGTVGAAGTAILADNSVQNRSNVIGFLLNPAATYASGASCLFLRKGRLKTTTALFTPGARYYLGSNGAITAQSGSVVYPDALVEVGTAISTTELIVDISLPLLGVADYPMGTLRAYPAGGATDLGYIPCDGIIPPAGSGYVVGTIYAVPVSGANLTWYNLYRVYTYPQYLLVGTGTIATSGGASSDGNGVMTGFFKVLTLGTISQIIDYQDYVALYGTNAVYIINATGLTNPDPTVPVGYFKVPLNKNGATNSPYEMAAYTPSYQPLVPIVDYLRSTGTTTSGGVVTLDLTPFTLSGPQNSNGLTLDQFIPQLYVTVASVLTKISAVTWTLSGSNILTGTAATYPNDAYILVVYKPEALARYQESINILSTINTASNYAISSTAVVSYLANNGGAATLILGNDAAGSIVQIRGALQLGDSSSIDSLAIQGPLTIKTDANATVLSVDNATGLVTSAAAPTIAGHLVNKQYSDLHAFNTTVAILGAFVNGTFTGAAPYNTGVHGVLLGTNGGFDSDMLDERHVGGWGWKSDTAPSVSANQPLARTNSSVPEITTNGALEIGKAINMYLATTATKPAVYPAANNVVSTMIQTVGVAITSSYLQVSNPNSSVQGVQIGNPVNANSVNLISVSNALLVTNDATASASPTSWASVKAAAFQTVSTITAKKNVEIFARSGLEIIKGTEIVEYCLKTDDRPRVGFIAERTDELLAGVNHNENDIGTTLGVALKAIQELAADNAALREEIESLKARF